MDDPICQLILTLSCKSESLGDDVILHQNRQIIKVISDIGRFDKKFTGLLIYGQHLKSRNILQSIA